MKGVTTTLEDVHEKLLQMFSDKTILLGHSLESDLIALKVNKRVLYNKKKNQSTFHVNDKPNNGLPYFR